MIKLLSIELKKILSYPTFWVFAGLYAVMVSIVFFAIPNINLNHLPISLKSYYTFPDLWHTLTFIAGFFNLLLGVLMIILITNEFTFRTLRQNIIDGWNITDTLAAKIILMIFLTFCTTVYIFIFGLIYGLIISPNIDTTSVFSEISFVLVYFVQALAYLCFALFMGTLFKKAGIGIIFFLLYSKMVEPLIGWMLPNSISDYLPFHNISSLIDNPAFKLAGLTVLNSPLMGIHFVFTLVYSFAFIFATYILLKKRDN